jgi:nucleotide-binding universal stress UspA family protein
MEEFNEQELRENMDMFSASVAAEHVALVSPRLDTIVVALDQSNQDRTTEAMAIGLAQRYDARLHITYATADVWDEAKARYVLERHQSLAERGVQVTHSQAEGTPVDQILEVCQAVQGDLIVFCAPYLEDFLMLGHESVGSNTDMLLHRSTVPLLIVREPQDDPLACLRQVLCPLTQHDNDSILTAAWALTILAPGGHLRVMGVADEEAITLAQHLIGQHIDIHNFDLSMLAGINAPRNAGLIAALQRRSQEANLGCTVTVQAGEFVVRVAEYANAQPCLVALGGLQTRTDVMSQRLQALVRELRHPVLVV